MVRLNGVEYAYRPGMTLKELVEDHNTKRPRITFDGFVVLVNSIALSPPQTQERILQDCDNILITPLLDGG